MNTQKTSRKIDAKFSIAIAGLIVISLLAIPLYLNYSIDPFHFFRKSDYYFTQQRFQNPGLAKHQDYDAVIIGDSLTENITPKIAQKYFPDSNFLKLSSEGATLYEENLILQTAVNSGKLQKVLWSLPYPTLDYEVNEVKSDGAFPFYLYNTDLISTVRYLIDPIVLMTSIKLKLYPENNENITIDLEHLNVWIDVIKRPYSKEDALAAYYERLYRDGLIESNGHWNEKAQADLIARNSNKLAKFKENIDQNLVKIIKENPNVNFIIYFPPLSVLNYKLCELSGQLNNVLEGREYVCKQLDDVKNVCIYDFQHLEELTHNLNNYKDTLHYSTQIDAYILDAISTNKYRIADLSMLENNNNIIKTQAINYLPETIDLTYLKNLSTVK